MMKHTITNNNVLKSIAICLILIWTSNSSFCQSGNCDTTRISFTGEGLPKGFDSGELTIESIQLPFPTVIEQAMQSGVLSAGRPGKIDVQLLDQKAEVTGAAGHFRCFTCGSLYTRFY
jgi:hypothetical protein